VECGSLLPLLTRELARGLGGRDESVTQLEAPCSVTASELALGKAAPRRRTPQRFAQIPPPGPGPTLGVVAGGGVQIELRWTSLSCRVAKKPRAL
jgi:hypothetical protein